MIHNIKYDNDLLFAINITGNENYELNININAGIASKDYLYSKIIDSKETNLEFNLLEGEWKDFQYVFNLTEDLSLMYSSENYYIFFEIYSTNPNSQLSNVKIFFTNNFISTIIRACPIPIPDQIIYNVESEDDDSVIYSVNKSITIFNLNSHKK